jgi:hypothetical protein
MAKKKVAKKKKKPRAKGIPNKYKGVKRGNSNIGIEGEPYQVRPGEVRNPNGRPKGVRYISEHMRDIMQMPCAALPAFTRICEDCEFGDPKKITVGKAIAIDLMLKAFGGKPQFTSEMLNRVEGKVRDELEVTGGSIVDAMSEYLKGKKNDG